MKKSSKRCNNSIQFLNIVKDLLENPVVNEMKNYRQHYDTSCYAHCVEVAYISFVICKKFHLDYVSAARAGVLHDLFLYDWRNSKEALQLEQYHAFIHPKIALENAKKITSLNTKEVDIITKHMWPVTFFKFPKYKETFIITLVDKYSALHSFFTNFCVKNACY